MSIKRRLEIELQNARSALPDEHKLKLDKAWTLAALLQEPQTLNPMGKPPKDNRLVLLVGEDIGFYTGHFDGSTWSVLDLEGSCDFKPGELPFDCGGWIECPKVDIEDTDA